MTEWTTEYRHACGAAELGNHAVSVTIACLDGRRTSVRSVVDALRSAPDAETIERAVLRASELPPSRHCRDPEMADGLMPDDPKDVAAVRALRAQLRTAEIARTLRNTAEAYALLEEATRVAEEIGYAPVRAEVDLAAGLLHLSAGAKELGETRLRSAFEGAASSGHDVVAARALLALATHTTSATPGSAEARKALSHARAWVERSGDPGVEIDFAQTLSRVRFGSGDYSAARAEATRAVALSERFHGPRHLAHAESLGHLGKMQLHSGLYEEAKETLEAALEIATMALGPHHPHRARALPEPRGRSALPGRLGRRPSHR